MSDPVARLSISLPQELDAQVRKLAQEEHLTISALMREVLVKHIRDKAVQSKGYADGR